MSDSYELSPLAVNDLSEIWDYTYQTWGADQADECVLAINQACEGLATATSNGRLAGQSAEQVRPGYRKQIIGSHVLFFTCKSNDVVNVVRILNQRMDVIAHL